MDIFSIPIINYHKIDFRKDIGLTSRNPADFEKDIKALAEAGYGFLTFSDLINHSITSSSKQIIITFDDGYESVYLNALPVMEKYEAKGTIFIPLNYIGRFNDWDVQVKSLKFKHLNEFQINELLETGFEIGAHGFSHKALTHMTLEQAREEISSVKTEMENRFNTMINVFCYPFGRYDNDILEIVKKTGYKYGIASQYIIRPPEQLSIFALPRLNIYRFDNSDKILDRLDRHNTFSVRDWIIQRGSSATILLQRFNNHNNNEISE
ncbi:MAG: polysaccharide deacetylase family protein [Calditrichaceae bacterium]|nr:polysaccharide deacetylase family protein [Calditrichaceae bacterium]MBN2710386.1 polysaccharide deacetylase family protein [Calditrichaceae bacterium]RQV92892.1 MAG: polysaccharide deacetylase family protein [Calditrichota bacterium]